jgi:hypothetical protein
MKYDTKAVNKNIAIKRKNNPKIDCVLRLSKKADVFLKADGLDELEVVFFDLAI